MAINVSVPSTRIKGLMNQFENMFTNRLNKDPAGPAVRYERA